MYGGIYPGFLLRTGICGSSMITIYRTIRPSPATGTLTGRPPHDRQHIVRYCFQTLDGMGTGRGNALSSILVAPPNGVVRNGLSRAWAFGTVSEELVAHYPATKQPTLLGEPKPHASTTGEAHPL